MASNSVHVYMTSIFRNRDIANFTYLRNCANLLLILVAFGRSPKRTRVRRVHVPNSLNKAYHFSLFDITEPILHMLASHQFGTADCQRNRPGCAYDHAASASSVNMLRPRADMTQLPPAHQPAMSSCTHRRRTPPFRPCCRDCA